MPQLGGTVTLAGGFFLRCLRALAAAVCRTEIGDSALPDISPAPLTANLLNVLR
jgi:hypothetical protein